MAETSTGRALAERAVEARGIGCYDLPILHYFHDSPAFGRRLISLPACGQLCEKRGERGHLESSK